MAAATYESILDEIYKQLLSKLERRDDESLRFIASGATDTVLDKDVLLRLFATLEPLEPPQDSEFNGRATAITGYEFTERVEQRKLQRFLAILIFASCSIEATRLFTRKLVANNTWPITSRSGRPLDSLPADRDGLEELFENDDVTIDKILAGQACFCPVSIEGREITVKNPQYNRFPYLKAPKEIGKGSFGTVYKVRIAKGYFYDPVSKQWNSDTQPLARKDYTMSKEYKDQVHKEHNVINRIMEGAAGKCQNILESFCSLKVGNTYSILMPLAMFDLRHYMMEAHKANPGTPVAKAKMILAAEGLADGLRFLHTGIQSPDRMEDLVCYHMDLKPNNILLFRANRDNPESDEFIWKLSDFGMARVKVRPRDDDRGTESNFTSWFKRNQPEDPTASATVNRRGEGTYLAPESISAVPSMKTPSDVWALGCILSVLFTYLERGSVGITAYQERRFSDRNSDGFDRFFLRSRVFSRSQAHPTISKWHRELVSQATGRNQQEGKIIEKFLKFLENSVLKADPRDRCTAKVVREELLAAYRQYNKLQSRPSTGEDNLLNNLQPDPDGQSGTKSGIEMWRVSPFEAYKGCEISPDGTLVVFWTDIKLVLFTSQSILSGGYEAKPADEFTLPLRNCIWKSIALTERYLIASLTGTNFHCYLFNLEGGIQVDSNFSRWHQITLPQLREIQKIALSPEGNVVACILRHPEGETNSHRLFHAKVRDLIKIARRPSAVMSPVEEVQFSDMSIGEPWSIVSLDHLGENVTHLMFSSENRLYIAIRPNLTGPRREHKTLIISVSLSSKEISMLSIEPRGFDGANALVPLFTTFTPIHDEPPKCAVITREKSMQIQNLTRADRSCDLQVDTINYRVLNLMMDRENERIFALGAKSANNRMLVLEIPVLRPGSEFSAKETAKIQNLWYGDDYISRLVVDGDEKHILIASLAGGRRAYSAIFKVGLP